MELKYLFVAEFADGHRILQTPEDKSEQDPSKSEFYDVMEYEKKSPLIKFSIGHTSEDKWAVVDLVDGHFEINGHPFYLHLNLPSKEPKFRIIYFRIRTEQLTMIGDERIPTSLEPSYMLGWQTTIEDKNYQETIIIN